MLYMMVMKVGGRINRGRIKGKEVSVPFFVEKGEKRISVRIELPDSPLNTP